MSLVSASFFLFTLLVLLGCLILHKQNERKKIFLLVVSYYFYMTIDWRFSFLLIALTLINFFAGRIIASSDDRRVRKIAVTIAVVASLSILFFFKYFSFFSDSVASLLNFGPLERDHVFVDILLPVGISFMTFQAITYPLDLLSGKVDKEANLLDFSLFMAFFPQLLSGPIVRASSFLPQLDDNSGFTARNAMEGLALVVIGVAKKILIADVLAFHIVDPAFASPGDFSSGFLLIAVFAFSFQVYMDLSGYTDIARGVGRMLGYRLPINFNRPYMATSISNYWQRWHISMSSFLKTIFTRILWTRTGSMCTRIC